MNKIKLAIIGGLGDVSLTRKIPQIYSTNLSQKIDIASIVDLYPEEQVHTEQGLETLFHEIQTKRLKGEISAKDISKLKEEMLSGKVQYFQFSNSPSFFTRFFQFVNGLENTAIDISTPNRYHLELFEKIAEQTQAHVLVEKPFVCNTTQLNESRRFLETRIENSARVMMDVEHYSYYEALAEYIENLPEYIQRYGKIKSLLLILTETESFDSQRNKDIINISKSGGGVWLDLGIHPVSFMSLIGAKIKRGTVNKKSRKAEIPEIKSQEYGETEMLAEFGIEGENFSPNAKAKIHVGKAMPQKRKNFYIEHENGILDLNVLAKRTRAYSQNGERIFEKLYQDDAFYNVFDHFVQSVERKQIPRTALTKALVSLDSLFHVYAA
jgi:predicted dehydrogenase